MSDTSLYQSKPIITLNGAAIDKKLETDVLEIAVEESLHMPSMFRLVVHNVYASATEGDEEWKNDKYFNIGDRISIGFKSSTTEDIEFRKDNEDKHLIDGEITGLEVNFTNTSEAHIVVRGYDAFHRLHRGRHNRSFQYKTESDIAQIIAAECGIVSGQIDNSGAPRDYIFQENQTNMEFLRERAARIGFELFVQNDTLFFRQPTSETSLPLEWLVDINTFRVRVSSAEQVNAVEVHSWDYSQKKLIKETEKTEQLVTDTGNGKGSSTSTAFKVKNPTWYVVDQPVEKAAEAKQMAQALCTELGGEFVWADAKAEGNPEIRPGRVVELQDMGRYSGEYYVTETRHFYSKRVYKTEFMVRGLRDGNLLSTLAPKPRLQPGQTLLVGIVSDNRDPEGWGRVKVTLPTLAEAESESVSNWARVVGLGAGSDRGFYCLPEVDDEVLVGFEHGDIHRPYIIGGVWNGIDKTVETVDDTIDSGGKVRLRTIKTRTGHTIQFVEEDAGGTKAGIYITTTGGHNVHLCDSSSDKGIKLETSGGHRIHLNDSPKKSIDIQTVGGQYLTLNDSEGTGSIPHSEKRGDKGDKKKPSKSSKSSKPSKLLDQLREELPERDSKPPSPQKPYSPPPPLEASGVTVTLHAISIDAGTEVNIHANGIVSINAPEVNLSAATVTVEAVDTNFAGNVTIEGLLAVEGDITMDELQVVAI